MPGCNPDTLSIHPFNHPSMHISIYPVIHLTFIEGLVAIQSDQHGRKDPSSPTANILLGKNELQVNKYIN